MKKGLVFLILALLAGVAALTWFIRQNNESLVTDPFTAIPSDACLLVESEDFPDFLTGVTEGNRIFASLEQLQQLKQLCSELKGLRDFLNSAEVAALFEKNRAVVSFHIDGNGNLVPLLSMNLTNRAKYKSVLEILRATGAKRLDEKHFGKIKTDPFLIDTGSQLDTVWFSFRDGLLLSSVSADLLVRAAGINDAAGDIRQTPGFTRIMGAAGKNENKVFLIFKNFAPVIRSLIDRNESDADEKFAMLAGSAEADLHFSENGMVLSGYTGVSDSSDLLNKFRNGESGKMTTYEVLPTDVVAFETVIANPVFASQPGTLSADSSSMLFRALVPYLKNEVTRAVLPKEEGQNVVEKVMIFNLSNRQMAEQIISGYDRNPAFFQPDDQTSIPVYRISAGTRGFPLNRGLIGEADDTLFAFSDNYLIAGNTRYAVTKVLYDNILNKTIINDLSYRDFESTLPTRAEYYLYFVPEEIAGLLSRTLNDTVDRFIDDNIPFLGRFQLAGLKLSPSNRMIYNTFSVRFGEGPRKSTGAEWETLLDTSAAIKPFFFTNHNTGAREIFVQDLKNNIYLVNSAGRLLWKVSPGEKITGNVFMTDYYGNGKNQLFFAGTKNMYLIDRNGNFVEKYPVKLRAKASGPPALFDYDATGDYRIVIPGEDRYLYAYDKAGSIVKGWKPFRTGGLVKYEPKFFRISGKDYIVIADDRSVYFLDRTGNQRLRLKEAVTKASGSELRLGTGPVPAIVFSSPDGTVINVTFDGKVTRTVFRKFTQSHLFDYFDIDGDGQGEYVFIDQGILYLYDNDKTEIFTRDFGQSELQGPVFYTFSITDRKIGITDLSKKLVYLIDKDGDNMKGFPLRGASVFSIGKFSDRGDFRLIVGGEDNFLYNYRVETGNQ